MQDYIFTLNTFSTRICKDTAEHMLQIPLGGSEKSLLKFLLYESVLA